MSKTFKDMRELSAAKAKKIEKRKQAKKDVLALIASAYDTTTQVLEFFDDNEERLTLDDVKALV